MKVLHYSLGVYPDKQGGLVKYSTELAKTQSANNTVYYLIPGKLGIIDRRTSIIRDKKYKNLSVFRIENPLPIPIYAGIKEPELFTKKADENVYLQFLRELDIEVVHLHSIMGLHEELLSAAKQLNIPVFMTTHDYFGICPIVKLFKNGDICTNKRIDGECGKCSVNAYSYLKMAFGQSILYRELKSNHIMNKLRKNALKEKEPSNADKESCKESLDEAVNYEALEKYYQSLFSKIDYYLFNSSQTKRVFAERIKITDGTIEPITLPSITDQRKKHEFIKDGILHVGFMGEPTVFKGFEMIKEAVENLYSSGYKIELDVYCDYIEENECIKCKGRYSSENLLGIYDRLDLIAVPSIWYETFSLVTAEALAAGMPCLVTDRVGAKEFIKNNSSGFVIKPDELENKLQEIAVNPDILTDINEYLIKMDFPFDYSKHVKRIVHLYEEEIKRRQNK